MTEARAVPPDFRLPWNTTVTMADVWSAERAEFLRIKAQRESRVLAKPKSHDPRIAFAGAEA